MADWQTISRLCREALSLETAERASFLDDACSGNPNLRQHFRSMVETDSGPNTDTLVDRLIAGLGPLLADSGSIPEITRRTDEDEQQDANEERGAASQHTAFRSSPFSEMDAATLGDLLSVMQPCGFAKGDYLIQQGDVADGLLLLLSGVAWATVRDAPSDRPPVGIFGRGDIVGEMSLVTDEPRSADVVARTAVGALRLSSADFETMASRHPDLRVILTEVVTSRLGRARFDGLGGKDIHGYRIRQSLGRGGQSVVYEAEQLATGNTVALKMMNHRLIYHPLAIRRFKREAAILKTLDHPSLARLYDNFSAYKTEFLAMEFCQGSTLAQTITASGALAEAVVRPLLGQLAVALTYIHERGVIHRDLKPSNIMLGPSGSIKLLDFGIGTFARDSAAWHDTAAGPASTELIGTPRYMAPEQFSKGDADRRADFYGFACVAFEALSGRPVIGASDIVGIILEQAKFSLPAREQVGAGISAEMHNVLLHGLAYDPEARTLDLERLVSWAGPVDPRKSA